VEVSGRNDFTNGNGDDLRSGFVYIWRDRKHKRYYIGSHWGMEDDGYICSSNWMKASYKRRPQDFKRRILERHISISYSELLEREHRWLAMIKDEELRIRYYNLHKDRNHWMACVNSKTIKEKIALKTKEAMQRPEVRQKYLEGLKTRDITNIPRGETHWSRREGYVSPRKGAGHTDEARQKIKDARAIQTFSQESIDKRKETRKTWVKSDDGITWKNKLSNRMKGNTYTLGKAPPNKGIPMKEETRQKCIANHWSKRPDAYLIRQRISESKK